MNVILHGVNRDQLMARHKANHAQVAYGNDLESAKKAMWTKAAMFHGIHLSILRITYGLLEMGIKVHLCGTVTEK